MLHYNILLPEIQPYVFRDDGIFPNSRYPVLFYKHCVELPETGADEAFIELFTASGWENAWINGVYGYHHYHSTAHEVMGICAGGATLQLGGDHGIKLELNKGDVLIIPAGVAHKNIIATADFSCVGAYPAGQDYDMNYGEPGERPRADENISKVALPATDPVFGEQKTILTYWLDTES